MDLMKLLNDGPFSVTFWRALANIFFFIILVLIPIVAHYIKTKKEQEDFLKQIKDMLAIQDTKLQSMIDFVQKNERLDEHIKEFLEYAKNNRYLDIDKQQKINIGEYETTLDLLQQLLSKTTQSSRPKRKNSKIDGYMDMNGED